MPRRSSRVAKQKRVNYNEDAMFYRMTKTKKADWEEVEDLDPVPVYRDKPMYRKRLPKQKKIVKIPPKKPKKKVIDLTKKAKKNCKCCIEPRKPARKFEIKIKYLIER